MRKTKKLSKQRASRLKRIAKRLASYSAAAAATVVASKNTANAAEIVHDIPDVTVEEITDERGVFFNMINGSTNLADYRGAPYGQYNFYNYTQGIFR